MPTIFVVDDDPGVSRALQSVAQLLGLPIAPLASARAFLASYDPSQPGCLVLDIKIPDMTGLELQRRLIQDWIRLPIIMISGHADVRIAVEAMSQGAMTLLEKPFRLDELVAHVRKALEFDAANREAQARQAEAELRFARLTHREREVLDWAIAGKTNKQIAAQLHLSVRAVEDRRARLLKKLGIRSLAELAPIQLPNALGRHTESRSRG